MMLAVPTIGILGSVLATTLRGHENDIYFQVGLLARWVWLPRTAS